MVEMKYMDPENDRYRFYVRKCMNDYALQVLVVTSGENIPLTPAVAGQLQISIPSGYRVQCCTYEAATQVLADTAQLNNWVYVK